MDDQVAEAQDVAGRLVSLNEVPYEGPNEDQTRSDLATDVARALHEFLDAKAFDALDRAMGEFFV